MSVESPASERFDFRDVPDPAARVASRPPPEVEAPTEASPTRAGHQRRTWLAEVLVGAWLLAAAFRLGVRPDVDGEWLARFAALAVVGLAAHRFALAPRRALGPHVRVAQAIVVLVPLSFAAIALVGARGSPGDGLAPEPLGACFLTTLLVGAFPLLVSAVLHRRAFAAIPAWRGAVLGTIGGLLASTVMAAHCTVDACPHVVLAHGIPILIGAAIGAALGARVGRL